MKRLTSTLVLIVLTTATAAQAQEHGGVRPTERTFGPPTEVIAAWEDGQGDLLPGPPAWVVEMRKGALKNEGGMPPWVAARHAMAAEVGLPGPPAEAIEAWQNGEGDQLPGPPSFVREFFRMFR